MSGDKHGTPAGAEAETNAQEAADLDLEIVSDTFRSLVDQDAFDKLIVSWNRKLSALDAKPKRGGRLFSETLLRQLGAAQATLERLDIRMLADPLERIVSEVAGPAMVLTPELRVASVNMEGAASFGAMSGAFFDADAIDPASRRAFDAVLRTAHRKGNAAQSVVHVQDQARPGRRFHAEVFLVQLPRQAKPYLAIRTLELPWSAETSQKLIEAFGLTEAEVEVGRHFFELCDLNAVAEARGVSLHTVRTQMKTIQAKTDAASQADLIRLFAMVASRQLLETRGLRSTWTDPLDREEIIETPSGRRIAWTWMGAQNGTPAVFLRGLAMGYLLPPQAEHRLKAAGIKLLVPSRPGYGNSSLQEELSPLEDNRLALHEFMEHLGLRGCVGIGLSDGIVPLLAEQDLHPDRFRALVSVGFAGCLNRAACRNLPMPQTTMMRLAKTAPALLDLIAKLGYRMMQQHGLDWYMERAYASRPRDLETCRDAEMATLVRDACAHMTVQGTRSFVRDMQMFHAPVEEGIDRLCIPMLSMVPTEDGVFDRDDYRDLERRNPRVTVLPIEGTADLLIYQETARIMDQIIAMVEQHR